MKLCCVEAEWKWDPPDRQTVAPMLDLLEAQGVAECARRDAVTEGELLHLIERWATDGAFRGFRYLYLASHGESGKVWFADKRRTSIGRVADRIKPCPSAKHRVAHFGSCSVLADDRLAEDFMDRSGIGALYGYSEDVGWIDSAALDLLLIQATAHCFDSGNALPRRRHRDVMTAFLTDHAALVERLGLCIWTRSGTRVERIGETQTTIE
jgi:hypothetical protein